VGDVVARGNLAQIRGDTTRCYCTTVYDIPMCQQAWGGVILGGKIASIFFNTAEDSGALPIECVSRR